MAGGAVVDVEVVDPNLELKLWAESAPHEVGKLEFMIQTQACKDGHTSE